MGDFTPEDRQLLVNVAQATAATKTAVDANAEAHRREIDALGARVTEVKADLDGDIVVVHERIKDVRKSIRRVSATIGSIAAAAVSGGWQGVKSVFGLDS